MIIAEQKEPLIRFYDADHSYWHGDNKLLSVSGLWKNYKHDFDSHHYAMAHAYEVVAPERAKEVFYTHGKDNKTALKILEKEYSKELTQPHYEAVLQKWKDMSFEATERGTAYHLMRELRSYRQGFEINPYTGTSLPVRKYDKKYDNESLAEDLYDLPDGCYPELLIFNLEYGLVGQEDRVWIETIQGKRYAYSRDYKTDKVIKKGFYNKRTKSFTRLKRPVSHLIDSTINFYSLKISTYSWMLEQFGYVIGGQGFEHIVDTATDKEFVYECRYRKAEVEAVLKHFFV